MVSQLQEIWSGLFIPDPDSDFLPIPDPGPDPGVKCATYESLKMIDGFKEFFYDLLHRFALNCSKRNVHRIRRF